MVSISIGSGNFRRFDFRNIINVFRQKIIYLFNDGFETGF